MKIILAIFVAGVVSLFAYNHHSDFNQGFDQGYQNHHNGYGSHHNGYGSHHNGSHHNGCC